LQPPHLTGSTSETSPIQESKQERPAQATRGNKKKKRVKKNLQKAKNLTTTCEHRKHHRNRDYHERWKKSMTSHKHHAAGAHPSFQFHEPLSIAVHPKH
jgi:hypothetical protein